MVYREGVSERAKHGNKSWLASRVFLVFQNEMECTNKLDLKILPSALRVTVWVSKNNCALSEIVIFLHKWIFSNFI